MTQPALAVAQLPEPLEIVVRSTGNLVAYACPTCGLLFILSKDGTEEERAGKKEDAVTHCVKTCVCGKPLDYHYRLRCPECRAQIEEEKEQARFDKAQKLLLEEYDDPVYWEGHVGGLGDGYFSSVEEVLDYCESDGVEVPRYVWACTSHPFKLDGERLIEHELGELYVDAGEDITDDARKKLQAYLDVWADEQHIVGWEYDYKRAVLLREAAAGVPPQAG